MARVGGAGLGRAGLGVTRGSGATRRGTYAALATVASSAVALGVGELIAVVVAPRSAPLVAVGGAVIDNVPEPVKQLGIRLFGTSDKIALQVGTVVLLAGFAALLGLVAARHLWAGLAGIAVFAAVGVVGAVTRIGADPTWALPSLVGAGAAGLTLWLLLRLSPAGRTADAATSSAEAPSAEAPSAATSSAATSSVEKLSAPGGEISAGVDRGVIGTGYQVIGTGTPRRSLLGACWAVIGGAACTSGEYRDVAATPYIAHQARVSFR
jgi:hypothetical protein